MHIHSYLLKYRTHMNPFALIKVNRGTEVQPYTRELIRIETHSLIHAHS